MRQLPPTDVIRFLIFGHGVKLFTVAALAKAPPCFPDNLRLASGILGELGEWSALFPGCNYAMACAESQRIVVDVDVPGNGHLEDGRPWVERMRQEHGDSFLDTCQVQTPSGGVQFHYAWPPGIPKIVSRNGANAFVPGVDIRASGGYALVPPSKIIMSDGTVGTYNWVWKEPSFQSQPIAPPDWLLELLLTPSGSSPNGRRHLLPEKYDADGKVRPGNRHCSLFRAACRYRSRGLTEAEMLERCWQLNVSSFEPPLSFEDCVRQVHGAAKYPPGPRITCGGR
jgi:hypothetical protein